MSSDESYARGEKHIPVQDDDKPVESGIDEATADSDAQLGTHTNPNMPGLKHLLTPTFCRAR